MKRRPKWSRHPIVTWHLVVFVTVLVSGPIHPAAAASAPPESIHVVAAGDIAHCATTADEQTAQLIDAAEPDLLLALGDLAYNEGTVEEFANCYDPTWGRHRSITRPAVGNHDYLTANADPYFDYFGAAAGERDKGYYSFDVGSWHVIVLNSNCSKVGGCDATSPQYQWLAADLAANERTCVLATMHHPRFSSGRHGSDEGYRPFWQLLESAGTDVVLTGHEHSYERFAPQTSDGVASAIGIRQFVVGTGGIGLREHTTVAPNSEVRIVEHGVLDLELGPDGYDWEFVRVGGSSDDSGSGGCGEPNDDGRRTIRSVVSVGLDDVEERSSGLMYVNSSDLELVTDGSAQVVGVRFGGVGVPAGAVVESAFVQFTTDEVSSGDALLTVWGEASDSAGPFGTSAGDVSGRVRTSASVEWVPPVWSVVGERGDGQRTSDLGPVVSEIVSRSGWVSGGAMVFVFEGSGRRTAESFEGSRANAPQLVITYR